MHQLVPSLQPLYFHARDDFLLIFLQLRVPTTHVTDRRFTAIADARLTSPNKQQDESSLLSPKVQRRARSLNFERDAKDTNGVQQAELASGFKEFNAKPSNVRKHILFASVFVFLENQTKTRDLCHRWVKYLADKHVI